MTPYDPSDEEILKQYAADELERINESYPITGKSVVIIVKGNALQHATNLLLSRAHKLDKDTIDTCIKDILELREFFNSL